MGAQCVQPNPRRRPAAARSVACEPHCPPADAASGTSGVGVGEEPEPSGGNAPFARGVPVACAPEAGGRIVGASSGGDTAGVLDAPVPDAAADAPLAGTPISGGTDAGNGADACDGVTTGAGVTADAGAAEEAGATGRGGA